MDHDPWWRALRIAIGAGNAATVVQVLEAELPEDGLQLAGDRLLLALDRDAARAAELSRRRRGRSTRSPHRRRVAGGRHRLRPRRRRRDDRR